MIPTQTRQVFKLTLILHFSFKNHRLKEGVDKIKRTKIRHKKLPFQD